MGVALTDDKRKILITYDTGETKILSPVSWRELSTIIEYQKILLEAFVEKKFFLGETLVDPVVIKAIDKLCELLPTENNVTLSTQDLAFEDILHVFFTTNNEYDDDPAFASCRVKVDGTLCPSYLSIIHGLNFFQMALLSYKKMEEIAKEE